MNSTLSLPLTRLPWCICRSPSSVRTVCLLFPCLVHLSESVTAGCRATEGWWTLSDPPRVSSPVLTPLSLGPSSDSQELFLPQYLASLLHSSLPSGQMSGKQNPFTLSVGDRCPRLRVQSGQHLSLYLQSSPACCLTQILAMIHSHGSFSPRI